ncbi:MAG TPA: hypothetical protein VFR85_05600 [Anaeromyxobacteraceae bacterium]|nr:hypothetical protein [Anaeromyxobacteraceae bacterium]
MASTLPARSAIALAAALACGCHAFRPVGSLRGADGETALQVAAVRVPAPPLGEEALVTLDVVRSDRRRVDEARLARLSEPECQGGPSARSVVLRGASGQPLTTRTLGGEARSLELAFGRDDLGRTIGDEPVFLDLRLVPEEAQAPGRCLRVPLVPAPEQVALVEAPLWDVGAGGRVLWLPTPSHGLGWAWLVFGQGGLFVGPVRLGIEAGGGGGEPRDAGTGRSAALYGGALRVDGLLLSLPAGDAGRLGLEGQLGWDFWWAEAQQDYLGTPLSTGASWLFQGPRAALRLAFLPSAPDWNGFFGRRDATALGLDLYAAYWFSSGADPAWVFGLGLAGHLAL